VASFVGERCWCGQLEKDLILEDMVRWLGDRKGDARVCVDSTDGEDGIGDDNVDAVGEVGNSGVREGASRRVGVEGREGEGD
jgi:hypothetical protein